MKPPQVHNGLSYSRSIVAPSGEATVNPQRTVDCTEGKRTVIHPGCPSCVSVPRSTVVTLNRPPVHRAATAAIVEET